MKTQKIKAIFLDFGDTLVSLVPSKEELVIHAAHCIGLELGFEAVKRAYQIVDFHYKYSSVTIRNPNTRSDFYKNYNKQLCEALGIASFFDVLHPHLVSTFKEKRRWELIEDVSQILDSLYHQRIPLAIVANWDRNLPELATNLGIAKFFASIVSSQEVGIEKPHPAIFNQALYDLSLFVKADPVLYIGNDYRLDVLSARAAGLIPVLIDRENCYPHADCLHFNSIKEWLSFLRSAHAEWKL